jgi:hypothetical protein
MFNSTPYDIKKIKKLIEQKIQEPESVQKADSESDSDKMEE